MTAVAQVGTSVWRGEVRAGERAVPEEVAVALSYDRETFAVMMASPVDLQDFAVGFSLSEGIIGSPADIVGFETIAVDAGIECRMNLTPQLREALQARRRRIAGPVGCGLCGLDSLNENAGGSDCRCF
jgi:FdhD protein